MDRSFHRPVLPTVWSVPIISDYVFNHPNSGRHALKLSVAEYGHYLCSGTSYTSGGDDFFQAKTSNIISGAILWNPYSSNNSNTVPPSPVTVGGPDGTVYKFTFPWPAPQPYGTYFGIPANSIEDRNGNLINISLSGTALTATDTLGRPVLSTSSFDSSSNDTITVSGPLSYTVTWVNISSSFSVGSNYVGLSCKNPGSIQPYSGTQSVIRTIKLPNGESYEFAYDSDDPSLYDASGQGPFGLVSKITYPDGGYVRYVWGLNTLSDLVSFQDNTQTYRNNYCQYQYGTPVILFRYVSLDGQTESQEQDFSYSTTWDTNDRTFWDSKQTVAKTILTPSDLNTGTFFYSVYTYGPTSQPTPPNDYTQTAAEIPEELTVAENNSNGNTLRTTNKTWLDQYLLTCESTTQDGTTKRTDYKYSSPGGQVTDKKEWDWGQAPACGSTATGTPLRETVTAYWSGATLAGTAIYDKPSSITINGNGTKTALTTFAYDGTPVSSAGITVGRDSAYNGNTSVARGNATSMSRWVSSSGTSLTWNYTYDDTGQKLTVKDPKGNSTSYSYTDNFPTCGSAPGSTNAYLTQTTDAKNYTHKLSYRYCDGQLNSTTDWNGQTTSYSYVDSLNRLTRISYPDGGSTTLGYGGNACTVASSATILLSGTSNFTKTATMDGLCHVIETAVTSDPTGTDYTGTTCDGLGRVWEVSNPYRSTSDPTYGLTTNTYDAVGRITAVLYPDGSSQTSSYSANTTIVIDPAGNTRTLTYDGLGRLTSVNEASLYTTNYTYDALDDLLSVAQGSQNRSYSWDSLARLTSSTNPESGTTHYCYTTTSPCVTPDTGTTLCSGDPSATCTRTDALSITTTYSYNDALNRLTSKAYSGGTPTASFSYDETSVTLGSWTSPTLNYPKHRLTHTTTKSGSTLLTATVQDYDQMGRPENYWQCTPLNCGTSSIWAAQYIYDKAGDVTSWNHPAGFTITHTINGARQISKATSSISDSTDPVTLATAAYTAFGSLSTLTNGCVGTGCISVQETYAYNKRLQAAVIELGQSSNHSQYNCRVYDYYAGVQNASRCSESSSNWPTGTNDNGNVAGYHYFGNSSLVHCPVYTYDAVNRLTNATVTNCGSTQLFNQTYSYTGDGSTGQYGNMSCTPSAPKCVNLTYNATSNHITTSGYAYDAAGDVTGDGTYTYTWDGEGRLTIVKNGGGTAISTNTYNALGQRVRDVTSTATTDEAYGAGGNLLWRYTGSTSTNRSFVPLNGRPLAEYYSSATLFDHLDELGSIVAGTFYDGTLCQERLFYPWGELWQGSGSCGMQQTFAELPDYDSETDQYNTLNRHYTPIGRWMSPDPSGSKAADPKDPQTWNMYAYVQNNPFDPYRSQWAHSCVFESHELQ